jgi:hypothetical protein
LPEWTNSFIDGMDGTKAQQQSCTMADSMHEPTSGQVDISLPYSANMIADLYTEHPVANLPLKYGVRLRAVIPACIWSPTSSHPQHNQLELLRTDHTVKSVSYPSGTSGTLSLQNLLRALPPLLVSIVTVVTNTCSGCTSVRR